MKEPVNRKHESLPELKVSILGAGNMGRRLGKALCQIPGVAVKHVFSRRLVAAQALAAELGGEGVDRMDPVFSDPDVAAVVICLPTHTRSQTLKVAVDSGKHIFCEKPLALDAAMAKEIDSMLSGYSRCVMVGQVLRFFWEYRQLRHKVLEGEVGQIGTVRLSRCVGYPGRESWFADPTRSGGVVLDLMIHDIDFLLWTFGGVRQVMAKSLTGSGLEGLDYALLNIQMQSGALAQLEGSWAHPVGSFHQSVEICGSLGLLSYDNLASHNFQWASTIETQHQSGSRISLPDTDPGSDPYFAEVSHFVNCIRHQQPPVVSWREALQACQVAFLAQESAQRGLPIRVTH